MLGKHSVIYFLGRGLPGIINFLAMSIYTRLVAPNEYGKYSIIFATVMLMTMIFYQWIRLTLLRFLPKATNPEEEGQLFASVFIGFLVSGLLSILFLGVYLIFFKNQYSMVLLGGGILLLWLQSLYEIGLEYFRSNLKVKRYSIINFIRSILALLFGAFFSYLGFGANGLILGLNISIVLIISIYYRSVLLKMFKSIKFFNKTAFFSHMSYGVPLTASYAMSYVFNTSDRFFIQHYVGAASTGIYSVGYDLSKQTLWVIMMSINLASYPLVLRALEAKEFVKANEQLKSYLLILIAISFPAAFGLAFLAKPITSILIGKSYSSEVAIIVPYISIGALIAGLKAYYIDLSFHLSKRSWMQLWSVSISAVINIALNFILIPRIGIMGAVYSSVICYTVDFLISAYLTTKCFALPVPWLNVGKLVLSTGVMVIVILLIKPVLSGPIGLAIIITVGGLIYLLLLFLFRLVNFKKIIGQFK